MSNVVSLCEYRARREQRSSLPLTEDKAWEIAISSHCVDAVTGEEVAGVPTVQLVQSAPAGESFTARLFEGVLYWVDPAPRNLEWMRALGWHLQQVRLVPDARRGAR